MRIVAIFCMGILLTACTQQAAQVDSRGSKFFGKNGESGGSSYGARGYNSPPPRVVSYGTTSESTANITSVSTKDLEPPPKNEVQHAPAESVAPRNLWQKPEAKSAAPSSFIAPVEGKISAAYGKRSNGMGNDGITYSAPLGEPVYASSPGEVAYVGNEIKSYGNMVIIKHDGNFNSSYAHLGRMVVAKGAKVKQGQIIGYVGQTGDASEPELHFSLRKGTETVDPATYLGKRLAAR